MVKEKKEKEQKAKVNIYTVDDLVKKFNGGISKPKTKKQ